MRALFPRRITSRKNGIDFSYVIFNTFISARCSVGRYSFRAIQNGTISVWTPRSRYAGRDRAPRIATLCDHTVVLFLAYDFAMAGHTNRVTGVRFCGNSTRLHHSGECAEANHGLRVQSVGYGAFEQDVCGRWRVEKGSSLSGGFPVLYVSHRPPFSTFLSFPSRFPPPSQSFPPHLPLPSPLIFHSSPPTPKLRQLLSVEKYAVVPPRLSIYLPTRNLILVVFTRLCPFPALICGLRSRGGPAYPSQARTHTGCIITPNGPLQQGTSEAAFACGTMDGSERSCSRKGRPSD